MQADQSSFPATESQLTDIVVKLLEERDLDLVVEGERRRGREGQEVPLGSRLSLCGGGVLGEVKPRVSEQPWVTLECLPSGG